MARRDGSQNKTKNNIAARKEGRLYVWKKVIIINCQEVI